MYIYTYMASALYLPAGLFTSVEIPFEYYTIQSRIKK